LLAGTEDADRCPCARENDTTNRSSMASLAHTIAAHHSTAANQDSPLRNQISSRNLQEQVPRDCTSRQRIEQRDTDTLPASDTALCKRTRSLACTSPIGPEFLNIAKTTKRQDTHEATLQSTTHANLYSRSILDHTHFAVSQFEITRRPYSCNSRWSPWTDPITKTQPNDEHKSPR